MAFNDFDETDDLTAGLLPVKDRQIKVASNNNRLPYSIIKTAGSGFLDIGSNRFYFEGNPKLATYKPGSFWKTSEIDGKLYLEKCGVDQQQKQADVSIPQEFPTEQELNEFAEENGFKVNYENDMYILKGNGKSVTFEDLGGALKQASLEKQADSGEEPPLRTLPESVELDTVNKYQEIEKERELSESERSDLSLLEENLERKGLD